MYDQVLMNYTSEHYELRVKAAERAYRRSQLLRDEPVPAQHVLARLGGLLVRAGARLQQESAPEMGRA
jgi:hypothetical protein